MENIEFNKVTWYSKLGAIILFIIVLPALSFYVGEQYGSLKTESPDALNENTSSGVLPTLKFNQNDNGKMITLSNVTNIEISLPMPGEGEYAFENPEYDTSLLHLNNHVHIPPVSKNSGNSGTDVWTFTTIKSGVTDITINAVHSGQGGNAVNIFKSSFGIR